VAFVTLVAVLVFTAALLIAVLIGLMARTLLRPGRMTDAKAIVRLQRLSPADLALRYEDVVFHVRDEQSGEPLRIAGWWIPASAPNATRTLLLIHGYADAKVGAIAWAPLLHSLGWNLLAIDLRAHGESGGTMSTAGYFERHDVSQVINQLRAVRPRETGTLGLFGVSLGAAVAVAVAAMRDDVAGIILESPFADYRRAVAAHGEMRGLPGGWMRELAIHLSEIQSGADFRAVRPQDLLEKVVCPVMVIHAGLDQFIPPSDAQAMAAALGARGNQRDVLWSIPQAGHVLGLPSAADEYRARVGAFLQSLPEHFVNDSEAAPAPSASFSSEAS
jgi:pimeloyl-ACP methyl ester carboxylesterase